MPDIFDTLATPQEDVFDALAPAPVVPAERGLVGETVAGFKRGGLQLVDMAGNIARAVDPEGGVDVVRNAGLGFSKFAKERALQPDVAASSYIENNPILGNIPKAAEMVIPSVGVPLAIGVGAGVAGLSAPVAAAAGIVGAGTAFGLSQFQDTKERGLEKGLTEEQATTAGIKTGLSEGVLEAASNTIPAAKIFKLGKPVAGQVIKSMFGAPTMKAAVKTLVNDAAQIMTGEVSTEMAQAYTQGLTEKNAGIRPDADPWQEAKDVIGPTIALSLMLGGAVGGANKLSKVATERALTNAGAGEDVRRQAADNVYAGLVQAEADGVAPAGGAENFKVNALEAIQNKAPLTLSDELLAPRAATPEADLFDTTVDVPEEAAAANIVEKLANGVAPSDAIDEHNAEVADLKNELNAVRDEKIAEALNLEEPAPAPQELSTDLPIPVDKPELLDPETGELTPAPTITDPLDAYRGYASEKSATKARGGVPETHEVVQRPSDGLWVRRPKAVERRQDLSLRERWDSLTPEEQYAEAHTDKLTGLQNSSAWNTISETPHGKTVASMDTAGLEWINDTFGHDAGDAFLKTVADAMREHGVNGYRKGGDELTGLFDSPEHASEIISKVQDTLANKTLMVTTPDGVQTSYKGWRLDYGTGSDFKTADAELYAKREAAAAAGLRTERGTKPYGLVEAVSEGVKAVDNSKPETALEITPNQVKGSISVYNVDDVSALGYDSETGVYTLRERGVDGPVDVATYEVIGGKIQNFKTEATALDGFDREQQIQEAQSLVERIEAGRGRDIPKIKELKDAAKKGVRIYDSKYIAAADKSLKELFVRHGATPFEKWSTDDRLAALNYGISDERGGRHPAGSFRESKNRALRDKLSKVAGVFGHDVTLLADFPGRDSYGFISEGDSKHIYIFDTKHSDSPLAVFGHELLHQMKRADIALYRELGTEFNKLKDQPALDTYFKEAHPNQIDENGASYAASEEWVADVFGLSMGRQGFWDAFEKTSPSLAARVARFVHELIQKFKNRLFTARAGLAAATIKDFKAVDKLAADVAARYAQRLKKDAVAGDVQAVKELGAWHGSPHDHDKFDMSKVGTGEGAQAYGYGLYFAGSRDVAEWYKESLSNRAQKATVGGRGLDLFAAIPTTETSAVNNLMWDANGRKPDFNKTISRLEESLHGAHSYLNSEGRASVREQIQWIKDNKDDITIGTDGRLYSVELAPSEDEYLLWDKPLSEQSEKVKVALAEIDRSKLKAYSRTAKKLEAYFDGEPNRYGDIALGHDLYSALSDYGTGDQKAASEYLHSLGIRGIKYADGSSRGVANTQPQRIAELKQKIAAREEQLKNPPEWTAEQEGTLERWGRQLEEMKASLAEVEAEKNIDYNYVIFNDEDVSITAKFSRELNDVTKATKAVNSFFKGIPYGQLLEDIGSNIYRFLMPVDRSVTLAASQKTFAPIKALLNQFVRQRKEKAGRIQSDMTDGAHIWKRFEKHFKTDAEVQNFTDMVWNATEYELHANPDIASGWTEKSWDEAGMTERTGKSLGQVKKIIADQYKKLSPEQKIVHQEMLHHVQQMYLAGRQAELAWLNQDEVKKAESWLLNEEGDKPELADLVKEVNEHYPTLRGDYMPLMRFGSLIVRTYEQDENGELGNRTRTEFFDSPQEARLYVEATNKTPGKHAKLETNPEYRKDVVNIPASLVDKISKAAEKQGITGDALEDLKQSIEGIRANMLPRNSIASSKLHREGVAGYEKDVIRVYLTYVRNHALANAQLTHGAKIEQTFRDMRNNVDAISSEPDYDVDAVRHMSTLIDNLYDVEKSGSREKVNEFTKTVGKVTFVWYLSSPSIWAVQWSQPFMVTIPKMAARHGFGKAFSAYTQAAKRFMHGDFSDDKIDAFDRSHEYVGQRVADILDRSREASGAERKKLDAELKAIYNGFKDPKERRLLILKVLSHQGQIDLAMAHNAQDIVAGAKPGEKVVNKIIDKAAFFMQKSETGSRRAAAISAFELQFTGDNFTEANDYATHIISDTLMDFDAQNRGAAWRGNTGRILGQFQFFRMHMMGKLIQLSKDAIGGEYARAIAEATTEEEKNAAVKARKEARKELAFVMGSSFALAGAAGTPLAVLLGNTGMSALWGALAFMFGDDDDPWDPQREFELATREALGDTVGNVVLKGLPSLVGADVSRRIGLGGMGNIISGEPPAGLTGTAKANWYAGRILGPSWGAVSDNMRAFDAMADGDLSAAIRYGSPKVMRDVVKMFNIADKGVEGGGKTLQQPEDVSVWSMALMFSGIDPTEVSLAQEESRYLKNISTELSQRRSKLIRHLAEATVEQDHDAKEAAIEKINAFSATQPMLKITQQEVVQKIKKVRDGQAGKLSKREALIEGEFGKVK